MTEVYHAGSATALDDSLVYDLHSHSRASDGLLEPAALVERAARAGVDCLALTDHDTTAGIEAAEAEARRQGLRLLPGVEISVTWHGQLLHILGLAIDPATAVLQAGLADLRERRLRRAEAMARRLERAGLEDALAGAARQAEGSAIIGRAHFARELVEQGLVRDIQAAFRRYLRRGKPGYAACEWAGLDEVIGWIRAAGGVAVIAHPARYRLSRQRLRQLCTDFRELGGRGIEVVSGSHATNDEIRSLAVLARDFGLLASQGSDFHDPALSWTALGRLPRMPLGLDPVWRLWEAPAAGRRQAV